MVAGLEEILVEPSPVVEIRRIEIDECIFSELRHLIPEERSNVLIVATDVTFPVFDGENLVSKDFPVKSSGHVVSSVLLSKTANGTAFQNAGMIRAIEIKCGKAVFERITVRTFVDSALPFPFFDRQGYRANSFGKSVRFG